MRNLKYFFAVICLSLFVNVCLNGQELANASAGATIASSTLAENSSVSSVVPRAAALDDEFKSLPDKIRQLVASTTLEAEISNARSKFTTNKSNLNELKTSGVYSFDKISEIRAAARESHQGIGRLQEKITGNIKAVENLRQSWENQKSSWTALREAQTAENEALKSIFKDAGSMIQKAQKLLDGVESPLVEIQKKAIELNSDHQKFIAEIDSIISGMRKDLFRRSRPAMFTPSFLKQFDKSQWQEFWVGIASLKLPQSDFFSAQGWVIGLQLFGILFFVWLFSSIAIEKARKLGLGFLIERRYSAAMVAGIAAFYPLFEDLPNIVRVFMWALLAIAGARLVAGVIETTWRRRLIYLLAALFLTSQLCYLINLPSPIFRLYVATVGLLGALLCFWRARINQVQNSSIWFILAVKTGGLTMLIVFLAQVAGFAGLANHLLEVAIKSVFFLLIIWIVNLILRGLAEAIVDNRFSCQSKIVRNNAAMIINRLKMLVDILSIFLGLAGLQTVWGIKDSFQDGIAGVLNLGINLQGERITLGIIATAVFLWYAAMFCSWLIQRVLDDEVYPRKNVEAGVGISINRLINYAFVIIGAVIALSTLGIGLSSLAVLMGAFGIGIGFGLQNIVNNFASGLILLFERSIKIGDVVQINGTWGTIKNLGLRATVVQAFDKSEMIVPNSDLVSSTVTNWTLSDRQTRVILPVGVAYGSDVPLVISILKEIAQACPYVMKNPEPQILFMNFGNSSLDFELRVYVSDLDNMLKVRNEINLEIDRKFRENKVEIPFPQNDVHIRTMDDNFKQAVNSIVKGESKTEK
jgi:small-conductance mechanosensitive channel